MRKRRVSRCLLRADLALDDGSLEEARAALNEARRLEPGAPGLAELESRYARLQEQARSTAVVTPHAAAVVAMKLGPARQRSVGVAMVSILATGLVLAALYAGWIGFGGDGPTTLPEAVPPPETSLVAEIAAAVAPARRLRIVHETVAATEATPKLAQQELELPPASVPIADADVTPALDVSLPAVGSGSAPPASALPTSDVRTDLPPAVTAQPPAGPPLNATLELPLPDSPRPTAPAATPPAEATDPPASSPTRVDERDRIRAVLARYESAYTALDAAAARAVWPSVDQRALARAFDGLAAQQVKLGQCDVRVDGTTASAQCSGSASWTPKVGGGARMQARRWEFQLRNANAGWQITSAAIR
jgi:hypothetical protein